MSKLITHVVHLTTDELKEIINESLKRFLKKSDENPSTDKTNLIPELLTRQQVADQFGVSFVTLHNWVKHGVLPKPIKKGKMVYFLKKEIIESLQKKQ